jgi:hypothetical protein
MNYKSGHFYLQGDTFFQAHELHHLAVSRVSWQSSLSAGTQLPVCRFLPLGR